jgi:zinc transport system substrate-binding protein
MKTFPLPIARPSAALLGIWFFFVSVAPAAPADKFRVLTTVFPIQEFARAVVGERGDVRLLLPPGAGVHTWQPRAGDLIRMAECDLFILVGANLEPWVPDLMKGLSGRKIATLELTRGLELIPSQDREHAGEHGHGSAEAFDPHIWLDFRLCGTIVDRIRDAIVSMDPEGAEVYRRNAEAYKEKLSRLDAEYAKSLALCPRKKFILAGHAAFGYLAKRYGLEQISLYGLSPDSQPTPRVLMDVVNTARREGIDVVFLESSASPDLARTLAGEIGARTLVLNPGHNLTREEIQKKVDFFDIMETNLKRLRNGLGCD